MTEDTNEKSPNSQTVWLRKQYDESCVIQLPFFVRHRKYNRIQIENKPEEGCKYIQIYSPVFCDSYYRKCAGVQWFPYISDLACKKTVYPLFLSSKLETFNNFSITTNVIDNFMHPRLENVVIKPETSYLRSTWPIYTSNKCKFRISANRCTMAYTGWIRFFPRKMFLVVAICLLLVFGCLKGH